VGHQIANAITATVKAHVIQLAISVSANMTGLCYQMMEFESHYRNRTSYSSGKLDGHTRRKSLEIPTAKQIPGFGRH
jgi:hypothetical protein